MATLPVFDRLGAEVGTYEIDPAELAPRVNRQLLHDAVVMYQCNSRQGTFKTKGRGEVAGSTRKLYRQKGTGNARVGPRRTGKRVGGGHTFAKRPRDFSYRMPRAALRLATRMAIASKIQSASVVLIDELSFAEPKTRDMASILKVLRLQGVRTLVATAAHDPNVYRSARNIENVQVAAVGDLNALSVLSPRKILMTRAALDAVRNKGKV
ncbi:MAG: 50S ribosomal protein L4 [Planctomycetes bacterium]|nr:50S ribosomal protein L4 [Planctomycetota bacterium]